MCEGGIRSCDLSFHPRVFININFSKRENSNDDLADSF